MSLLLQGGLVGSLFANRVLDHYGRRGATRLNGLLMLVGNAIMFVSSSPLLLVLGRFVNGVAAGVGLCTTPVYLDELSPPAIRGRVGVFNQIGVVIGILATQGIGLYVASFGQWRPVPACSGALGLAQLLLSGYIVDTPVWLRHSGRETEAHAVIARIWKKEDAAARCMSIPRARCSILTSAAVEADDDSVVDRLLDESEHSAIGGNAPSEPAQRQQPVSVLGAFKAKELRQPLLIVLWAMAAQQLCGQSCRVPSGRLLNS